VSLEKNSSCAVWVKSSCERRIDKMGDRNVAITRCEEQAEQIFNTR